LVVFVWDGAVVPVVGLGCAPPVPWVVVPEGGVVAAGVVVVGVPVAGVVVVP
jgi:hypothetical protein